MALRNLFLWTLMGTGASAFGINANATLERFLACSTGIAAENLEEVLPGTSLEVVRARRNILLNSNTRIALVKGELEIQRAAAQAIHMVSAERSQPYTEKNLRDFAADPNASTIEEFLGGEKGTVLLIGVHDQLTETVGESVAQYLKRIQPDRRVIVGIDGPYNLQGSGAIIRELREQVRYPVEIPDLRTRREDIPAIAIQLVKEAALARNRPEKRFHPFAMEVLRSHQWPNGIDELRTAIEVAFGAAGEDPIIRMHYIPDSVSGSRFQPWTAGEVVSVASDAGNYRPISIDLIEQEHILATLEWTKWNKSQAAHILGIERSTLDRKLRKYGKERPPRS